MRLLIPITVLLLSGCGLINFPMINAPKPPDQVYGYHQTTNTSPLVLQTPDGKSYVWEQKTQTLDVSYDRKDHPLSWWQRFTNWLGSFGMLSIITLIVCLVAFPGATLGFLWTRYQKFKKALTQTVDAIEESKAIEKDKDLKDSLSATHDNDTKKLIDDLRRQ